MTAWLFALALYAQACTYVWSRPNQVGRHRATLRARRFAATRTAQTANQPVPCHWCGYINPPGTYSCGRCGQYLG